MSLWRPSLSEFVEPFAKPRLWDVSLESHRKGIDNAHIDVFLSPRLRAGVRETIDELIQRDVRGRGRSIADEPMGAQESKSLRQCYQGIFESVSDQPGVVSVAERLVLLQVSILKYLVQSVAPEGVALGRELGNGAKADTRRVLHLLFRQIKRLEGNHLEKVRESLGGKAWPIPQRAFFNPVLTVPRLEHVKELAPAYPIARLGDGGDVDWLYRTNQCVTTVFQHYLPTWTRFSSSRGHAEADVGTKARERRDQGQLQAFLGTEMLLSRFVPSEELRSGNSSWLDDPENLRMFLASGGDSTNLSSWLPESGFVDLRDSDLFGVRETGIDRSHQADMAESMTGRETCWTQDGWQAFQRAIVHELHRCLELQGLGQRIALLYWLRSIASQLGRPVPLSLVTDFVAGHLTRRRLAQRLETLHLALEPASVARILERVAASLRRLEPTEQARYFNAYLTDFLVLRRDLKLAYKAYAAMDRIRLLTDPDEVRLSRANQSLHEFSCGDGTPRAKRRIRSHAVLKADVRGSTRITQGLVDQGLNPASHFGLNFFDPVNRLLPDFGAEKLFVEGDAVILAFFEREAEPAPMSVSRACALARNMLQVVSLQNAVNRKHGLPDLELGLGISYSRREPNFLYDEGQRIMISGAINRADRLSSCAAVLRTAGFRPAHEAFRVEVVRNTSAGSGAVNGDAFLGYNVNGIKLEKAAFFKLQREINLRQVRLPEKEAESSLFFAGSFPDFTGQEHWLVLRYAPVRQWDGRSLGVADPDRGHFFEVIADEALATRVRKLAIGKEGLPLRGRG